MADGTVVAALIAAGGTACGGLGTGIGVVLSRRSAREAAINADRAQDAREQTEQKQLGYDLLELAINSAHREIERLRNQQNEDRKQHRREMAALRADVEACNDDRRRLLVQLRRYENGAGDA